MTARDEEDDELRTRPGQFLTVEKEGVNYKETSLKGVVSTYFRIESDVLIHLEKIARHKQWDLSDNKITHVITGATRERFRAIGTEGDYPIFHVRIKSKLEPGKAVITETYTSSGHSLRANLCIGLGDDAIVKLISDDDLSGQIVVFGIEGRFYFGKNSGTILFPHWQEHVVTGSGAAEVQASWEFRFKSLMLSPKGYLPLFGMMLHDSGTAGTTDVRVVSGTADVRVVGSVGVSLSNEAGFANLFKTVAESISTIRKQTYYSMILLAVLVGFLVWHFR